MKKGVFGVKSTAVLLLSLFVTVSMGSLLCFASETTNYVENGSFTPGTGGQLGAIPGWTTSIAVGSMDLYLGDYNYGNSENLPDGVYLALRKESHPDAAAVSVSQTISDLPEGIYKLSAWMWAANNIDSFTITITDGVNTSTISAVLTEKGYKETEIEITSGSATITIAADNTVKTAAMDALADDIKLIKVGEITVVTDVPITTDIPSTSDVPITTDIPSTSDVPNTTNIQTGDSAIVVIVCIMVASFAVCLILKKRKQGE
jgi:hypothetical protein